MYSFLLQTCPNGCCEMDPLYSMILSTSLPSEYKLYNLKLIIKADLLLWFIYIFIDKNVFLLANQSYKTITLFIKSDRRKKST